MTTKKTKPKAKRTRKNGQPDLRTLPADKRPKPTTGQSRPEFKLPPDQLSKLENKVVTTLNGSGKGLRATQSVSEIAKATRLTQLQVRNSVRRLVPSGWVERVGEVLTDEGEPKPVRGHYRVSEKARKRLSS